MTNIPSPYRIPLFNAMNEEFLKRNWSLNIIFLTRSYRRRKWNVDESQFRFTYSYLRDIQFMRGEAFISLAFSLPKMLFEEDPDVVVVGGFSLAALWAAAYCRMFEKKLIIWSGETIAEDRLRRRFRFLRGRLRNVIMRNAQSFVAYGTEAKKYLLSQRISENKIFIGINTVDTEFLAVQMEKRMPLRESFLAEHQLPNLNILFVGYLEERKGVRLLLEAVREIQKAGFEVPFGTHIVGSGTEETSLKDYVERHGLKNIYFWGYQQKEAVPLYFSIADLLVFPSLSELYGLVPIEAMAFGVPVLCSVYAGVTPDLVVDGYNGYVIDPYNQVDFIGKIKHLLQKENVRKALAFHAIDTVKANFQIRNSVNGFLDSLNSALANERN